MFYGRGKTQNWKNTIGEIPEDGNYQFKFMNGSYDATGGLALGAGMYIDNIRVFGAVDYAAEVIEQIAKLVTYVSEDKDPDATRTLSLTLSNSIGGSVTKEATININNRFNHAPTVTTISENPTFFNLIKNEATIYSHTLISTIEEDQKIISFSLEVDGLVDGADEILKMDGLDISLVDGQSGATQMVLTLQLV